MDYVVCYLSYTSIRCVILDRMQRHLLAGHQVLRGKQARTRGIQEEVGANLGSRLTNYDHILDCECETGSRVVKHTTL